MVMIGLPVLVITAVFTFYETMGVTPRRSRRPSWAWRTPASSHGTCQGGLRTAHGRRHRAADKNSAPTGDAAEVAALLGPGTRLIPYNSGELQDRAPNGSDALERTCATP